MFHLLRVERLHSGLGLRNHSFRKQEEVGGSFLIACKVNSRCLHVQFSWGEDLGTSTQLRTQKWGKQRAFVKQKNKGEKGEESDKEGRDLQVPPHGYYQCWKILRGTGTFPSGARAPEKLSPPTFCNEGVD